MDPIDILERRIAALELEVLPQAQILEFDKTQLVTDLLIQAHSMTTTALSCREVITSVLRRMELIHDYLNPSYCEDQLDLHDKRQYILEMYPEVKRTMQYVVEFERLKAFLDSPSIQNIPDLVERLKQLTISNITSHEECKEVTDKILNTLQQYNDITKSIKILFAQLEQSITNIEISLQPKANVDN